MIRILLAEDHPTLRESLRRKIELEPDLQVVGEASDGLEAVDLAILFEPDLVLMNLVMPVIDGIEATRRIKAQRPEVKVLALSIHEDRSIMSAVFLAGADGYLVKLGQGDQIVAAIRATCGRPAP
jgi:DNA-binding NarL/FixJ family response regulator